MCPYRAQRPRAGRGSIRSSANGDPEHCKEALVLALAQRHGGAVPTLREPPQASRAVSTTMVTDGVRNRSREPCCGRPIHATCLACVEILGRRTARTTAIESVAVWRRAYLLFRRLAFVLGCLARLLLR